MEQKPKKTRRQQRPKARYANHFEVGHNAFEFLIDFGECYADSNKVRLHTRIVTAPTYAHTLLELLLGSIDRYQQTFGPIARPEE
jgi:hypothetical protein